jgi:polyhydroxyalkanoate synthase
VQRQPRKRRRRNHLWKRRRRSTKSSWRKRPKALAALSANLTQAMTRANTAISTAFVDQTKDAANWQPDPLGMQAALNDVWSHLASQPETLREAHATLWQRYADIWQKHATYMLTGNTPEEGPVRDKRFKDPEWRSNPAFSMLRESYLATASFITDLGEQRRRRR